MIINSNTASQQVSSLNGAIKVNQNDVKVNSYTSNYDKEAYVLDISSQKINLSDKPEAIIQSNNAYVNKNNEATHKILDDYYKKIVEDNKKFEDPLAHVYKKYNDKSYAYYIKDLTDEERFAAFTNEFDRQKGFKGSYSYLDPILTRNGIKPTNVYVEKAERNAYNREAVNSQFETLLNNYGITIPKDEKLTFTIEPNHFILKVNGAKDENLAQAIEDILNKNSENVKQLFFHINYMKSDSSTQFTKEKEDKWNIVNSAKEFTGYNLADLEVKGDRFLAPDGTDLFRIFKNNFDERYPNPGFDKNTILIYYENQLTELARKGFENVPDLVLSIEYENRSFYDIGQKENYGTGKTAWIEEWNIAKTSEYNAAQNKINYKSQYTENPSEFTRSINKYDLANELKDVIGYDLNDLKEENGKFLTSKGEDIFKLYKKELQSKYFFSKDLQEAKSDYFGNLLKDFSKIGLNNIPNFEAKKEEDLMQILNKIEPLEIYV
ncbi:DUF4885 family protein [Aliarcobacter cryaerophilus]|uniref:DUF4885 domain-containing protein n=1 Tax=Aliarcobacter cryaerophilus TaxID=28198 RepID=A0A2S9TJ05_9BACT|nr:DUF4885 family protein [Aliarcobacter cryaerophilus]PRM98838.1 hypothetical protein CJ670_00465 [Arcobacter cryaerophilus gv. crypticus]